MKVLKCQVWEYDKEKECGQKATHKCEQCGLLVCDYHEDENIGECPDCSPPKLIKIKVKK